LKQFAHFLTIFDAIFSERVCLLHFVNFITQNGATWRKTATRFHLVKQKKSTFLVVLAN